MKYKFAHFADIHWRGLTRHEEYKEVFNEAFKNLNVQKPDAIFIVGDIVHSKTQGITPELINNLCWFFTEFSKIAPVYITLGNHDGLIYNKDREDAISPIIKALNNKNLLLFKNTCQINYNNEININNFSCFDEDNWKNLSLQKEKINIGLFHGPINGCKIGEDDYSIDTDYEITLFKDYDFVFLGDIHKRQFLDIDNKIGYCGSTIQQNFGEGYEKGYLLWNIETDGNANVTNYSSEFIKLENKNPFITIEWKTNLEQTINYIKNNFPLRSRFRIYSNDSSFNNIEFKKISSILKNEGALEVSLKNDFKLNNKRSDFLQSDYKKLNLRDPNIILSLFKKHFDILKIEQKKQNEINDLFNKIWSKIDKKDSCEDNKWSLNKIEFDNIFGYGENNVIDFDKLEGVVGVFGKNRAGKSSICGSLMYTLFNSTDRGSISNLDIVNNKKDYCKSTAYISKLNKKYKIERQTVKKEDKKGNKSAITHLNLFEKDEIDGIYKDLSEESRKETEKTLRDIIGYSDDFLLTSLSAQGEMNAFIKYKGSDRKSILSKFLELDVFEKLNEIARQEAIFIKNSLKNTQDKNFETEIKNLLKKIEHNSIEQEKLEKEIKVLEKEKIEFEIQLSKFKEKIYSTDDLSNCTNEINELNNNITILSNEISLLEETKNKNNEKLKKLLDFKNNFNLDLLKNKLLELSNLNNEKIKFSHELEKENTKKDNLSSKISVLKDIPCQNKFPSCKFIIDANKAQEQIGEQNIKIENFNKILNELLEKIKELQSQNYNDKMQKYNEILSKIASLNIENGNFDNKTLKINSQISLNENKLKILNEKLNDIKEHLSDEKAKYISDLKNKLKKCTDNLTLKNNSLKKNIHESGTLNSDLSKTKADKEKYEDLINLYKTYDHFINATSNNGIPLEVIKSRLPEINNEIYQILQDVVDFTIELVSEEGTNNMEIYINNGITKSIIECASGQEKMMAALAIRVALTNVSQLSKSDILIIDEGFGTLDEENIESCNRLLKSLKKWFKTIIAISHMDSVKDSVDNLIEIVKINDYSSIIFD